MLHAALDERLDAIDSLTRVAEERLELVNRLDAELRKRRL
jgi:hypothetical protein